MTIIDVNWNDYDVTDINDLIGLARWRCRSESDVPLTHRTTTACCRLFEQSGSVFTSERSTQTPVEKTIAVDV